MPRSISIHSSLPSLWFCSYSLIFYLMVSLHLSITFSRWSSFNSSSLFALSWSVFLSSWSTCFTLTDIVCLLLVFKWLFVCYRDPQKPQSFKLPGQSNLSFSVCCHLSVCFVLQAGACAACAHIQFSKQSAAGTPFKDVARLFQSKMNRKTEQRALIHPK